MEEELQQSVLLSEEAGYDTADSALASDSKAAIPDALADGVTDISGGGRSGLDEDLNDRDASGEELDQDASGEEDTDPLARQIVVGDVVDDDEEGDDDDDENEDPDADADPDEDPDEDVDDDAEGEDEDPDEGVGAVKIRPGESDDEDVDGDDDEDDNDAESDVSDLPSAADEDSDEEAPAWEDANEVGEDEESDTAPSNTCVFCKQDEEDDPSEDFEAFLTCASCGENGTSVPHRHNNRTVPLTASAHQQCARDAAAMSEQNSKQLLNSLASRVLLILPSTSSVEMPRVFYR